MISLLLLGLGMMLVVEGFIYALFPGMVEDFLEAMRRLTLEHRRLLGLVVMALGIAIVWMARGLGA